MAKRKKIRNKKVSESEKIYKDLKKQLKDLEKKIAKLSTSEEATEFAEHHIKLIKFIQAQLREKKVSLKQANKSISKIKKLVKSELDSI